MPFAVTYLQNLDPLGSRVLSTILAGLPVVVLFYLLVPRRWLAPKAGAAGALTAILVAWLAFGMPIKMAAWSFTYGAAFGLMPIGWTVFNAMLVYNVTVETGQFNVIRRSVAGISKDARIQAILIGFAFGAFLEGAAGSGSPVAICGVMLVGLGFDPFRAAVICLIANTSPVAYGGLGTPIMVLGGVTDLPVNDLSVMAGHQLPFLSCLIPFYMVKCMCSWRKTFEVWPALLVGGVSFAVFQFTCATIHVYVPSLVLFQITDVGGGIFSLVVTALFLRCWKPKQEWHFEKGTAAKAAPAEEKKLDAKSGHGEINIAALLGNGQGDAEPPLTVWNVSKAWMPFALMSLLLLLAGYLRQQEIKQPLRLGPVKSIYMIDVPSLNEQSMRPERLHLVHTEEALALSLASSDPLSAAVNVQLTQQLTPKPEKAQFTFNWLTTPGTPVFLSGILSFFLLRLNPRQILNVLRKTCVQMKIPIPTIACMLGLSYVTRYAGMDATLGIAFAETGPLYPFFAAILGWLGVFLTGTDAGSNALFGSLQKITATEVYRGGAFATSGLELQQAQTLICTANSTGGVMGKMIDAQSICVATAATNQLGREADIFKAVFWHSIFLASIVGLMTLVQAYVPPFTRMVP
ncbi:MAG TPA: L-lactate permease [Gemmataceae bacterium]|nr:L-lactate permease [Gemmataceae bacterium]